MMGIKTIQDKVLEGRQFRRNDAHPELKAVEETDEKRVFGHACTFNEPYMLYRSKRGDVEIWEQVDPAAFDKCDMSDVIMQFDHSGRVLARTRNGTLKLTPDSTGLAVEADLTKSALGPGVYEDIRNGILDRMSFGFTVRADKREETMDEVGNIKMVRTITDVGKLYDVSVVSIPANDGTDISARSYCDGVIAELEAERLEVQKRERRKKALRLKLELIEGEIEHENY